MHTDLLFRGVQSLLPSFSYWLFSPLPFWGSRREGYREEFLGSCQGSISLSCPQKTKLKVVMCCNLVIPSNRGIYKVIWREFRCPLNIDKVLNHAFFLTFYFLEIKNQHLFIHLAKHCLELRFHFDISVMWAVHWWRLLLGLARKTFHFV